MSVKLSQNDLQQLCVEAGVPESQVAAVAATHPQSLECFFSAILYYFQSQDLWGAARRLLDCLVKGGLSAAVNPLLCLLAFVRKMRQGADPIMALFGLLACFLGIELPNEPNPPTPPGEIDPPNDRNVNRC
jgi:hypothetical protein